MGSVPRVKDWFSSVVRRVRAALSGERVAAVRGRMRAAFSGRRLTAARNRVEPLAGGERVAPVRARAQAAAAWAGGARRSVAASASRERARWGLRARHVRAAVGFVTVAGALALVALLVVAFGYRAQQGAPDEVGSADVAGQLQGRPSPIVTRLGVTRGRLGVRITLLRVERLDRGGRVYLKAVNGSKGRIAIPDTDIQLSQRYGKALPAVDPYVGRLPRFGTSIEPGESATSVRYFPRLRRGGAVVEVQWFSGDPDLEPPGPVSFSFEVT